MADEEHHEGGGGFFSNILGHHGGGEHKEEKEKEKDKDGDDRPVPPFDPLVPAFPKLGDISAKRDELHGRGDWPSLDPLDADLRDELIKYGELTQATYDSFDATSWSKYCGSCHYGLHHFFKKLGLEPLGYVATTYLYAMCHISLPRWLEKSLHVDKWDNHSNWIGYVAVAGADEANRIGYRDIVVAWRGTIAAEEWLKDLELGLVPLEDTEAEGRERPEVERGFHGMFNGKHDGAPFNNRSAKEQFLDELTRLIRHFEGNGEEVCITVTGHSLGGALALLSAYEAAVAFPHVPVTAFTFGGPRVGNKGFCDALAEKAVKVLRVVNKDDLVPRVPGVGFNVLPELEKLECITGPLNWVYEHAGHQLTVDHTKSPYVKRKSKVLDYHNLELYLHVVDGHDTAEGEHREGAKRDPTLVNKSSTMLRSETLIPECWFQAPNKGLVRNHYGRWVLPTREPEDIPKPGVCSEKLPT